MPKYEERPKINDIITIAYDSSLLDTAVLTVGRRTGNNMEIINHITGSAATSLYIKLITNTSLERGNKNE